MATILADGDGSQHKMWQPKPVSISTNLQPMDPVPTTPTVLLRKLNPNKPSSSELLSSTLLEALNNFLFRARMIPTVCSATDSAE